jgi:hypothetical protein
MNRAEILEMIEIYLGSDYNEKQFENMGLDQLRNNLGVIQYCKLTHQDKKYFSIHHLDSLDKKSFSIVRANIDNTYEKTKLAREIYDIKNFHFEFHNDKKSLKVMI